MPTNLEIRAQHARELAAYYASGKTAPKPVPLARKLAEARGARLVSDKSTAKSPPSSTAGVAPCDEGARDTIPAPPPCDKSSRSVRWVVCGDVHFCRHSEPHWRAFAAFVAEQRPDVLLLNGDMIDFGAISRFVKGADDPAEVLPEIEHFVREVNALAPHCGRVLLNAGNHEARWAAAIQGANAQALRGVLGLDLHSVLKRHGLTEKLEWCRERVGVRGVEVGDALARHGDRQAGKFSGRYVAATAMTRAMRNVLVSHHHKGQLHAETTEDRTVWGLAVPTMELEQEFALGGPWVRGFAVVEVAPDGETTPYLIIMNAKTGRFSYNGRVYGG